MPDSKFKPTPTADKKHGIQEILSMHNSKKRNLPDFLSSLVEEGSKDKKLKPNDFSTVAVQDLS